MSYEVAKKFWGTINDYPDYPHLLKRRFIDLSFILDYIGESKSILDIGCADCSMLILLRELTTLENLYGVDISRKMMRISPEIKLDVIDVTKDVKFPKTDITICFGMFPYIFDKEHLNNIISNIKSDLFLVRAPCTLKEEDEYINKFSTELNKDYSAIYRKPSSYIKVFLRFFDNIRTMRSYPDELEGKYGTKHYYFICRKKE